MFGNRVTLFKLLGQTLVYRMTIENPPAEAQRAAITFTDRPVTP